MNAILILLGLLALSTLAARRGGTEAFVTVAAVPLLVSAGALVGPAGLGFVLPSMVAALVAPVGVAAAWLALLVGLRTVPPNTASWARNTGWFIVLGGTSWVITSGCAGLAALGMGGLGTAVPVAADRPDLIWTLALAMGGVVCGSGLVGVKRWSDGWPDGPLKERIHFLCRHDDTFGVAAVLLLLALAPPSPPQLGLGLGSQGSALVVVATGVALAATAMLLGAAAKHPSNTARMAMLAIVVCGAGLSAARGLPEVLVAMVMGLALAVTGAGDRLMNPTLHATDRPVRMVVLVMAGIQLHLSWIGLGLGVALLGGRVVAKQLQARVLNRADQGFSLDAQVLMGSPGLAIPVALSLSQSPVMDPLGDLMFTAVTTCVCLTELLAFGLGFKTWLQTTGLRAKTLPSLRKITESRLPAVAPPTQDG